MQLTNFRANTLELIAVPVPTLAAETFLEPDHLSGLLDTTAMRLDSFGLYHNRQWLVSVMGVNRGVLKVVRIAAIIIFGFCAIAAWWFLPARRAEVRLSPKSTTSVARTVLGQQSIFLQTDSQWANDKIGGSGEPLKWVGCTVCCLSMALAHHGIDFNPGELNRRLKEADGYTFRGWVKWNALRQITGDKIRVQIPERPSHKEIESALEAGNPVLVKVRLSSGVQHWVLLVGRDGADYLMKDPLGDGQILALLSSVGSDILAVRIVQKVNA